MDNSDKNCRITDHPNLYNKALTILQRKGYTLFLWPVLEKDPSLGTYIASMGDRDFFADDPLRLLGIVAIWEELGDDWYTAPKYPTEKIQNKLIDESYPESVADYENFDEERFNALVDKCRYFFKKDYMPDKNIRQNISKEELFNCIIDLKNYKED